MPKSLAAGSNQLVMVTSLDVLEWIKPKWPEMFISEIINIQLREVLGKLVLIKISYIPSEIPGILTRKPNDGSEERGKTEKKNWFFYPFLD